MVNKFNGDYTKTFNAVQKAGQDYVNKNALSGIFKSTENPIIVNVEGYTVHIGGKVADGILDIGTFFIP